MKEISIYQIKKIILIGLISVLFCLQANGCLGLFGDDKADLDSTHHGGSVIASGATINFDTVKFGGVMVRVDSVSLTIPLDYFTNSVMPIFQGCAGCHIGPSGPGYLATGLDLTLDSAYNHLVNADSKLHTMKRVTPLVPDQSFLYNKISELTPLAGTQMPFGGALAPEDINTVYFWILAGASEKDAATVNF